MARILASAAFRQAGRSSAFLQFIVQQLLAGATARLKEYTIGVEVLGRDASYDPALDAIVRVEAGRLRSRLQEYYAGEGQADALILDLPKGTYVPHFFWRQDNASAASNPECEAAIQAPAGKRSLSFQLVAGALGLLAALLLIWHTSLQAPDGNGEAIGLTRVVVLPFFTFDPSTEQSSLARRLTEKVTGALVEDERLSVVPSSTARVYEGSNRSLQEIATGLGAQVVVEARLLSDSAPVRVEVFLTDATQHRKIWVSDAFTGQDADEVGTSIAEAVRKVLQERYASP